MPSVSIVEVQEKPFDDKVFRSVFTAVDMLGAAQAFARSGDKVLVKPNWRRWPSTSPQESEQQS